MGVALLCVCVCRAPTAALPGTTAAGDVELCAAISKVQASKKPDAKEDSERCTICFQYDVLDDNPLIVCEACEIFAHKVCGTLPHLPLLLPPSEYHIAKVAKQRCHQLSWRICTRCEPPIVLAWVRLRGNCDGLPLGPARHNTPASDGGSCLPYGALFSFRECSDCNARGHSPRDFAAVERV